MFRRRKSSSHHRHSLSPSNTQSAHSAASHAFLNSQPSSSSLSSAAAATALRNRTPTPTRVENVETKRMVQRRSSSSSQHLASPSLLRPASRQDLRRTRSSGSMTTRTFRDQSPHRPSSTTLPRRPTPPIPSIPSEYTSRSHPNGRSYSMGPTVRPPSPVVDTWRGMSVDRGRRGSSNGVPELQRPESRTSINFSYPLNSRPTSPTDPPPVTTYERRDAASGASLAARVSSAPLPQSQQVARQPVNTSPGGIAKERFVSPGRGTTPVGGTAIAAAQAAIVPRNDEHTPPAPMVRSVAPPAERGARVPQSKLAKVPDRKPCPYSGPTLSPPTVPEDHREDERSLQSDTEDKTSTPPPVGLASPEPPAGAKLPETPERRQQSGSSPLSSPESHRSPVPTHPLSPPTSQPTSSPERLTRFSDHLLVGGLATENLHRPPPRSVSPVKSAMKDSRKNAFSSDGITGATARPGPAMSEGSDGTSIASDDGVRAGIIRRKPVKVSFDDEAEIMGVAASPPTSPEDVCPDSPGRSKLKTGWFGANRRRTGPSALADEFTEMLKPRRALPSFGSVRRDREGDQYAGPPVHEESDNESTSSSELDEVRDTSTEPAVWGIMPNAPMQPLRQTQLNRVPSPVPEDSSEVSSKPSLSKENSPVTGAGEARAPAEQTATNGHPKPPRTPQSGLDIPGIAIQPATPEFKNERASLEWYDVPGGFPRTSVEMDRGRHNNPRRSLEKSVTFPSEGAESDDESGESVYSDAEETFDGNGFGSINAIVDTRRPQHRSEGPTDRNPLRQQPEEMPEVPEPCQIARVVTPAEGANVPRSFSPDSPHRLRPFSSAYPPFPTRPSGKVRSTPGDGTITGPPRRSMSADARRHADDDASVQPTARQLAGPRGRGRPVSWGPVSLAGPAGREQMHSPLQRVPSNGSDSSSSFKRSRRATHSPHHSMRRTLRTPPTETPSTPKHQTPMPLSHRSSTLTRPISSGSISGSGTLRATLRGQTPRREKRSLFSKGKLPSIKNSKPSSVPFTSRFADSDSDTGGHAYPRLGRKVSRRFEDVEGRATDDLRPVRGIPRRFDDGDSTELEDSSDNESRAARPQKPRAVANKAADPSASQQPALAAVAKSRGMTESQLEEFLRQPVSGRKPSLLHRFSIRKSKSPARGGLQSSVDAPPVLESAPVGGVTTTITANDGVAAPTPRLLKKRSSKSATDEGSGSGWPLRPPPVEGSTSASTNGRPRTADGTVGAGVPGPASAPEPAASHALDVGFARGRKSRFPRLRRAFGL
ncbi:hypothetical protein P168DRAFT_110383 [Aspergillus campestris IBT 28561]|uniref:Uncharacterized protein n=1 Tax=Aspergillus campestris (strain IBT 28561) TaxID=1392248 RepID=A0A2I1D930_ASPC2|nr:uncharacterized protein P168DRAFT_110383 [Aspergillus campestris IBT 28561]PKY06367.1 hypothetical protein P168DRAFT_110383 [Aspergillus campestris IBT 28561]